jgi:hypothetical protein
VRQVKCTVTGTLKFLVDKLARLFASNDHVLNLAVNDQPVAGFVYSFQTSPYSEFAPPSTGRFATFKVLGVDTDQFVIAVYDGIWNAPPTIEEFSKTEILCEHRFAHTGRKAIFGTLEERWDIANFQKIAILGFRKPSSYEKAASKKILGHGAAVWFASTHYASYAAEGEWRWRNERAALVEEQRQKSAKYEVERKAKEQRYRDRLSKLTWEQLLSETPFENWSQSPPFPSIEFTNSARTKIRQVCIKLQTLGQKPRKGEVRTILKECVLWFNKMDEDAGHVIETDEREDICAVLEEIAFVAKQKSLVDEIDVWRHW